MKIEADIKDFEHAMKDYLRFTNRTIVEAVNGKHRDLLFTAASACPEMSESDESIKARNASPAYVTSRVIHAYGRNQAGSSRVRARKKDGSFSVRKGQVRGAGQVWGRKEWSEIARKLRRKRPLRSYMRSAYVKAAQQFPQIRGKSSTRNKAKLKYFGDATSGHVSQAFRSTQYPTRAASTASMTWNAKNSKDAQEKYRIALAGLMKSYGLIEADIYEYIHEKLTGKARSVSA